VIVKKINRLGLNLGEVSIGLNFSLEARLAMYKKIIIRPPIKIRNKTIENQGVFNIKKRIRLKIKD